MGKILPILLALIGLGAGVGAGIALRPAPEIGAEAPPETCEADCPAHDPGSEKAATSEEMAAPDPQAEGEFVKMNNQFVVPIVSEEKVSALVVMSLSLELDPGGTEIFYQREPKVRDAFLQVLFDHANAGGFDGMFTQGRKMDSLRLALVEMARKVMGDMVRDVLITDILRQDS